MSVKIKELENIVTYKCLEIARHQEEVERHNKEIERLVAERKELYDQILKLSVEENRYLREVFEFKDDDEDKEKGK